MVVLVIEVLVVILVILVVLRQRQALAVASMQPVAFFDFPSLSLSNRLAAASWLYWLAVALFAVVAPLGG